MPLSRTGIIHQIIVNFPRCVRVFTIHSCRNAIVYPRTARLREPPPVQLQTCMYPYNVLDFAGDVVEAPLFEAETSAAVFESTCGTFSGVFSL